MSITRISAAWLGLVLAGPCLAQSAAPPSVSIAPLRVRATAPPEDDRRAPPPVAIGPIQARTGAVVAEELGSEERFNRGVVGTPASRREREAKKEDRPVSRSGEVPPPPRYDLDEPDSRDGRSKSGFAGFLDRLRGRNSDPDVGEPNGGGIFGSFRNSDHRLDGLVSPVGNPFLAEDPRTLTEVRPVYIYQKIPGSNAQLGGGTFQQFALQGRIAITERWSFVVHKLGLSIVDPGGSAAPGQKRESTFSEIWLGPKWNFYRNEQTQTAASVGLIIQLPFGGSGAYQDTGSLGLTPYVAYATTLGGGEYGTFSMMNTLGYSTGIKNDRSSFVYDSFQVDFDVRNRHFFHPIVGLNYYYYTSGGNERPTLNFEGADLANVGAPVGGRNYFTIDLGARVKFTEAFQVGGFAEFPLLGTRDLEQFRFGFDVILRY